MDAEAEKPTRYMGPSSMATNLGILLVIAVTVGVFGLVLLSVLFRRQRRALWRRPTAAPASADRVGGLRTSLGTVGVVLAVIVILATVPFLARRGAVCTQRIVITPGPPGTPLECVCDGGRLGPCFPPGP